jgi:hypothetical protein
LQIAWLTITDIFSFFEIVISNKGYEKLNLKKITTRGNPPEYAGILPEALVTMNSKKITASKLD